MSATITPALLSPAHLVSVPSDQAMAILGFYLTCLFLMVVFRPIYIIGMIGAAWLTLWSAMEFAQKGFTAQSQYIVIGVFVLAVVTWMRTKLLAWRNSSATQSKVKQHVTINKSADEQIAIQYPARTPRFTFQNVHGMKELKADLEKISHEIGERGKNGLIFYGPPGNGKTFIAEAYAGEIKANFLECRISEIASRWVNQSTEQINAMFQSARAQAPCVIFLDEVDSVLRSRSQMMGMGDAEAPRLANALLTAIADCRSNPQWQVVVIAATNFIDALDDAGIREGRFDFKQLIGAPDYEARKGILTSFCPVSIDAEAVGRVARRWEGFSVARIKEVADRAGQAAKSKGITTLTFDHLMAALRDVQGQRGLGLKENTPTLNQLHFDPKMRSDLQALAGRLNNVEQIEKLGGTVPKGVLFYGPPGTGKTAVAEALAKTSGWTFLRTTGEELVSDKDKIDQIVTKAEDLRPCIVFIDEADDILMDRSSNPWGRTATNKLLAVLEGARPLHDVMFIAATNFTNLDTAAVRGGRFSEKYRFELPSESAVDRIANDFMQSKPQTPWAFTSQQAADLLAGQAPSDVRDNLQKAINRAIGQGKTSVTIDDVQAIL